MNRPETQTPLRQKWKRPEDNERNIVKKYALYF